MSASGGYAPGSKYLERGRIKSSHIGKVWHEMNASERADYLDKTFRRNMPKCQCGSNLNPVNKLCPACGARRYGNEKK